MELPQKVDKGRFGILLMKKDIIEEIFAQSAPKFYIRGLRDLKENGVVVAEPLGIIQSFVMISIKNSTQSYNAT